MNKNVGIIDRTLRIVAGLLFAFHGVQKVLGVFTENQPPVGSQLWIGGMIGAVVKGSLASGEVRMADEVLAEPLLAADDPVHGNENLFAARRAVHEHGPDREVASACFDAWRSGRNQGAGDAQVFGVAEQAVGIQRPEGQAQQARDRRQRDVALVPADLQAEHLLALEFPSADEPTRAQPRPSIVAARA